MCAALGVAAGPQRRHGRRQHRQRLADRRLAAAADRARRHARAAPRRRAGARCRSRTSSSPTASRTARPGEFVEAVAGARARRRRSSFRAYKITKRFDQDISAGAAAPSARARRRHGRRARASPSAAWRRRRKRARGTPRRRCSASPGPRRRVARRAWRALASDFAPLDRHARQRPTTGCGGRANLLRRFWLETDRHRARSRHARSSAHATQA